MSHFFINDLFWREEQSRLCILPEISGRTLAAHCQVTEQTVSMWRHGGWPIPLIQSVKIGRFQNDYRHIQSVFRRNGILLGLSPVQMDKRSTGELLLHLTAHSARFFHLAIRLQQGEKMTPEEIDELEKEWEAMKQSGDALIQKAKEGQQPKGNGESHD